MQKRMIQIQDIPCLRFEASGLCTSGSETGSIFELVAEFGRFSPSAACAALKVKHDADVRRQCRIPVYVVQIISLLITFQ